MKRIYIDVDDGVDILTILKHLEKTDIDEEFIIGMGWIKK